MDNGAALVEYALIVMLIGVIASLSVSAVGKGVSRSFESVESMVNPTTTTTRPLTPEEKWEKAKADYDKAIDEAKANKAFDVAEANYNYDQAIQNNASLPKAQRQAANQEAKAKQADDKAAANSKYQAAVESAKEAKAAAKDEYNATK